MSISIIPTICDLCGKKTGSFYCKNGQWWDKYIDNGFRICLGCIKKKSGFAEDFEKNTGVDLAEHGNVIEGEWQDRYGGWNDAI